MRSVSRLYRESATTLVELHLAVAVAAWETGRADVAREALEYARERGADPGPLGPILHADPVAR